MKGGIVMIELHNICWTAPNGKEVLKNINLKIQDHRLTAISGPNGSGKTTLAKIIMGIEQPTSGKIIMDGKDITGMDVTERSLHGISFGFQQPVHFKGLTVRRLLYLSAGKVLNTEHAKELLSKVGLSSDYLQRQLDNTLSGGELKRIEIATVLARNTPVSVFDEPEAGIDLWSFDSLIHAFDDMRREDRTIVVISHQERILQIADEIVIIDQGVVSEHGPGPAVLSRMGRYHREIMGKGVHHE